jgi:hypothetical protein
MNTVKENNKKKVVTFRLTENDLKEYEAFCIDEQIRMSDFIRKALNDKRQEFYDSMPVIKFVQANELETV